GLNDDAPHSCHGRRGPGWRRGRPRRGGAATARPARPRHGAARGRARRGAVYRIRLPIRTIVLTKSIKPVTKPPPPFVLHAGRGCLQRVSKNPGKMKTRLIAVVLHPRDAKEVATPKSKREESWSIVVSLPRAGWFVWPWLLRSVPR